MMETRDYGLSAPEVERPPLDKVYELVNRLNDIETKHRHMSVELAEMDLKMALLRKELIDCLKWDDPRVVLLRFLAVQADNILADIPEPARSE